MANEPRDGTFWTQSLSGGGWERLGAVRDLRIGPSNSSPALAEQEFAHLRERLAREEERIFMEQFMGDFEDTGADAPSPTSATPEPESPSSSTDASGTPARTAGESAAFLREALQVNALREARYAAFREAPELPTTIGFVPGPQYGRRIFLAPQISMDSSLDDVAPVRSGTVIGEIAVDQARTLAMNLATVVMPNLGRFLEIPSRALMEEGEFIFQGEAFKVTRASGRDTLLVIRLGTSPTTSGSGGTAGPSLSYGSTTSPNTFHFPAPTGTVMYSTGTATTNPTYVGVPIQPFPPLPGGTGEPIWTVGVDESTRGHDEEVRLEDEDEEATPPKIPYTIMLTNVLARISETAEERVLVPTNGVVRKDGRAVMGRGFAASVKGRVKDSDLVLGKLITLYGSKVQWIVHNLYAFPTKDDWRNPSTLEIVVRSCKELRAIAEGRPGRWWLPLPGCGVGELDFKIVLPRVAEELEGLNYRLVTTDRGLYNQYEALVYGPPMEPPEVSGEVPF